MASRDPDFTSKTGVWETESNVCQTSPRSKQSLQQHPNPWAGEDGDQDAHSWGASNSILGTPPVLQHLQRQGVHGHNKQPTPHTDPSLGFLSSHMLFFTVSPHGMTLDAVHIRTSWVTHPLIKASLLSGALYTASLGQHWGKGRRRPPPLKHPGNLQCFSPLREARKDCAPLISTQKHSGYPDSLESSCLLGLGKRWTPWRDEKRIIF